MTISLVAPSLSTADGSAEGPSGEDWVQVGLTGVLTSFGRRTKGSAGGGKSWGGEGPDASSFSASTGLTGV